MRFQTIETVPIGDTEEVLRALELSLRELSDGVERDGRQIVVRGLGPSPKARNYRDMAVFDVVSQKGSTTIHADVNFLASALLGPAGQDLVVQTKLSSAFQRMRSRLHLTLIEGEMVAPPWTHVPHEESLRIGADPWAVESLVESFAAEELAAPVAEDQTEEEKPVVAAAAGDPVAEVAQDVSEQAAEASEEIPVAEVLVSAAAAEEIEEVAVAEAASIGGEEVNPAREAAEDMPVVSAGPADVPLVTRTVSAGSDSSASSTIFGHLASKLDSGIRRKALVERRAEGPTLQLGAAGVSHKTGVPALIATLLAIMVAAGSVYLYWSGQFNLAFAHKMISHAAPAPAPVPVIAAPEPAVVTPPVPEPPPRHEEANPKVWLELWADALRGRDPELQASFYADPVVHYQGDANVSKDVLTTGFRSAIQARDRLSTMKLQNIAVYPLSSSDVIVRLTKHYIDLNDGTNGSDAQIADRYVRSRLELKKSDGEWKIVSEQDQSSPSGR